jgi:transposase
MRKVKSFKKKIMLSRKNVGFLKSIIANSDQSPRIIKRAQILLAIRSGHVFSLIANIVGTSPRTVTYIVSRFRKNGLNAALFDAPRPGNSPLLSPAQNERVIALACTKPPEGYVRWTLSLLVDAVKNNKIVQSIGRETVRKSLLSHDLKPWRRKMWCVPKLDDQYIERMEDVLNLYQRRYNRLYPVVCMDEKPIQLLADTRSPIPISPGHPFRPDYEYKRHGVVNLFAAIEPLRGRLMLDPTLNRKGPAFAEYVKSVSLKYKYAKRIHLVFDNLSTHGIKSLVDHFGEAKAKKIWSRFKIHRTPKHGSWLNQAEMAIGLVSRQCLGKARIKSLEELIRRVKAYRQHRKAIAIQWKFTTGKARKIFGYYRKKSHG